MRVAIMQPYLFPYLGYFQLIAAVDKFIFYDDVNFIKGGWINRNRILLNGHPVYFTVPLSRASPYNKICDVEIDRHRDWSKPLFTSFAHAYGKSENFAEANELFVSVLAGEYTHVSDMAKASVLASCAKLGIDIEFKMSSVEYQNCHLVGADRVIDICLREGASEYVNLPGGRELYSETIFLDAGLKLSFLDPKLHPYRQKSASFIPALSILDLLASAGSAARDYLHSSRVGR